VVLMRIMDLADLWKSPIYAELAEKAIQYS